MQAKVITRMLSEGRTTDLANYIKSGNSIRDIFLMMVADELTKNGLSNKTLESQGALSNLTSLVSKADALIKNQTSTDSRDFLKHYLYALKKSITLWKDSRLETVCPALGRDFDDRAVAYLLKIWNFHLNNVGTSSYPILTHIERGIESQVKIIINAVRTSGAIPQASAEQLRHYTLQLENKLLDAWMNNAPDFEKIKAHLDEILKDKLLDMAKKGQLGAVLQTAVAKKLRSCLVNHITVIEDLNRFPGLLEKFNSIYKTLQAGNIRKDVTMETIDRIVENFGQFDKAANQDICNLMRDDIIPEVIATEHLSLELKRAAVTSMIRDQRNNQINILIGEYIQVLLNDTIAQEVSNDIRHNQGPFHGIIEQLIRQAVVAFRHGDKVVVELMPATKELFTELYDVINRAEGAINIQGQLAAMTQRIQALEKSNADLVRANGLKESAAATPPKEPSPSFFGQSKP
jgi:hypothetical protein